METIRLHPLPLEIPGRVARHLPGSTFRSKASFLPAQRRGGQRGRPQFSSLNNVNYKASPVSGGNSTLLHFVEPNSPNLARFYIWLFT